MSDFETVSRLMAPYAEWLGTKIWLCEKVGRRLSCVGRAGEERYDESFIVYEDERFVLFAEREFSDEERRVAEKIVASVRGVLDKVRQDGRGR